MKNTKTLAALLAACMAGALSADVVTMKSGDKLTGKITGGNKETLEFASDAAGAVKLNVADIESVESDSQMPVEMNDGTLVMATVGIAQGEMRLTGADGAEITPVAVETVNPDPDGWKYAVVGSYTANRGNTRNDTQGISAEAAYRAHRDRVTLAAAYARNRQTDVATGEKTTSEDNWSVRGQYDHFITKALYTYANARHETDHIANLNGRESAGAGLGYQWIESEGFGVKTECGATYFHEEFDVDVGGNERRDVASLRLAYAVHKEFDANVQLFHNLEYLVDVSEGDGFLLNADIGGRVKLTTHLLLEAKAEWRHNSNPFVDGVKKTDSRFVVGLGYAF